MGTIVTIQVLRPGSDAAISRAFDWLHWIESRCTRFDTNSELMQLCASPGVAVPVSPLVFEALRFAVLVAEESGGALDPTAGSSDASYLDIQFDAPHSAITLLKPMTLDLGAVAKGLAVDTAARELDPYKDFAIDAGGDLYLGGANAQGEPWSVGIQHPRRDGEVIETFRISDQAVCTSGDYERPLHILDPRSGQPACGAMSVTVIASSAMVADALATAAFVLGPAEGLPFLRRMGVEGLMVTPDGLCHAA